MITVALDAMGGDEGLAVSVPAAQRALQAYPDLHIVMVGLEQALTQALPTVPERMSIQPASEVVGMDELPSSALRSKKDSSMRVAINLVAQGKADAVVSSGNTGAFMATSRFVLRMIEGVDRPVLCSSLPTEKGPVWMLDLGANIDSTSDHLYQFAQMGNALVSALTGKKPSIGLLNIGEEEIKGNEVIKQAAQLLRSSDLNYYGFVEGDDIYKGTVDLVVCDGFVGNIALKSSEGVAKMIRHFLKQGFNQSWVHKLMGLIAMPVLSSLKAQLDPRRYNGASLLGLKGLAVKSHGGTDAKGLAAAIGVAYEEARHGLLAKIQQELSEEEHGERKADV